MRIKVGLKSNLGKDDLAFLDSLSPTRREQVLRGVSFTDNEALDNALDHIIDDDSSDGVMQLLRSQELRDKIFTEVAAKGYRAFGTKPVVQKNHKDFGKYPMIADTPINYPPEEQALLEHLSKLHEIDYIETGNTQPIDTNSPLYQRIVRGTSDITTQSKKGLFAEGGISPERAKHPDLKPLTDEIINEAPARFIYDNLAGNERGEQPITTVDRKGNRSSLPIEHKEAFKNRPDLGRDLDNRMLGSTVKNSILRAEPNTNRQVELLADSAMHGQYDYKEQFGRSPEEAMENWKMAYSKVQPWLTKL